MKIIIHPPEKASSGNQYITFIGEHESDYPLLEKLVRHRDYTGFQEKDGRILALQIVMRRMNEPRLIAEAEQRVGCKVTKQEPPAITHTLLTPIDSAATVPPPA